MSLDNALECSACKQQTAIRGWIHLYATLTQATMGKGADFLSAFVPGPGVFKVEVCLACLRFAPVLDYSEQELVDLEEYHEKQKKSMDAGNKLEKTFGGMLKKFADHGKEKP